MCPQIGIRERVPRDLSAAARALVKVHEADGYPVEGVDNPEAWLSPPGLERAWVGELGAAVVAHVGVTHPSSDDDAPSQLATTSIVPADEVRMLGRLFVCPSARGHAIGEHLVRAVMEYATSRGQILALDVMEKDRAAIRLYERLGWRLIGKAQHHVDGDQPVPAFCYVAP